MNWWLDPVSKIDYNHASLVFITAVTKIYKIDLKKFVKIYIIILPNRGLRKFLVVLGLTRIHDNCSKN